MLNELLYNEIHYYEKFGATNIFLPVPVFKTSPLYNEFVSSGSATIILSPGLTSGIVALVSRRDFRIRAPFFDSYLTSSANENLVQRKITDFLLSK